MESSSLNFEPRMGYFAAIRVKVKNPIPERFRDIIFDMGSDHFGAGLERIDNKWYLHSDKLRSLSVQDLKSFVSQMEYEYERVGIKVEIEMEDKNLRMVMTTSLNDFLESLADIEGVIIYGVALMGLNDTILGIKFPESVSYKVTNLILKLIKSAPFDVEILKLEKENDGDIPSFFKFNNLVKFDYSKLLLIKTRWEMTSEELKGQNKRIFLNEMRFQPKIFESYDSPIYAEFSSYISPQDVKGNAKFKIIGGNTGKIVEFDIKSKWFHDFYEDVIKPTRGPFFYWGYSDGRGNLDNYYIVPERNQVLFLKGLEKQWSEPSRANHKNIILKVDNLKETIERVGFLR